MFTIIIIIIFLIQNILGKYVKNTTYPNGPGDRFTKTAMSSFFFILLAFIARKRDRLDGTNRLPLKSYILVFPVNLRRLFYGYQFVKLQLLSLSDNALSDRMLYSLINYTS